MHTTRNPIAKARSHVAVAVLQAGIAVLDLADRARSKLLTSASSLLIEAAIATYPRSRWIDPMRDLTAYAEPEV